MRKFLVNATVAACFLASTAAGLPGSTTASFPRDDKAFAHVLNRIAFGPRHDDMARLRQIGLQRYIEEQLHPERIADEGVNGRLTSLATIRLSEDEIVARYEIPQLRARRERRREEMEREGSAERSPSGAAQENLRPNVPPEMMQRANQLVLELSEQKLLRAVYSERQLQEVLTDFWFNHFNVDARKGRARFMLTSYERDAIRPYVLGKFRDLLGATAKSPAMLFYLDNWMSADPNGPHLDARGTSPARLGRGFGRPFPGGPDGADNPARRMARGLNENYGRELMELHTLGVDGGYTQKDVTEVARAFTGWTIQNPMQGGGFRFEPRIHDDGEKIVLGRRIKTGGGQRDGEQVLDLLAAHPSTARFIATKLVRRFVSDTPPASLVDRAAARFRQSDGDLREVMRTILTSPEFLSPEAYRAKVKTPLEFLTSALRATGAEVQNAAPLVRVMQQLGMPLYQCQPPTGYKDTADAWVNAGALVNRMNTGLQLASDRLPGVSIDRAGLLHGPDSSSDLTAARTTVVQALLGNDVSQPTLDTIAKAESVAQMAALTLGSPEFQRK
jgi:uncharacterized protein (DUF1800 family)